MITVTCECGAKLRVKDELVGKKGKCPKCGQILALVQQDIQIDDTPAVQASPSSGGGTDKRACPGCGAQIPALSFSCEFCGATIQQGSVGPKGQQDISSVATVAHKFTGIFADSNMREAGRQAEKDAVLRDLQDLGDSPDKLVTTFAKYIEGAGVEYETDKLKAQICRAVITKLRAFQIKDRSLSSLVAELQEQYTQRLQHDRSRYRKECIAIIAGFVIIGVCVLTIIGVTWAHNDSVRNDVQTLIQQRRYSDARLRANNLWFDTGVDGPKTRALLKIIDSAEARDRADE